MFQFQMALFIIKLIEYPIINEIIIVGETAKKFKEQIKKQIKSKKMDLLLNL